MPAHWAAAFRRNEAGGIGDAASVGVSPELTPCFHEVLVAYPALAGNAGNAPFAVYDDQLLLGQVAVDQRSPPSGPVFQGVPWHSLGTFLTTQRHLAGHAVG